MTMHQNASPSVPSDPATITQRYDALVASGTIERDPAQEDVVAALDAMAIRLRDIKLTCFGFSHVLDRGDMCEKRRGIYIFGGVGRGKTMLMETAATSPRTELSSSLVSVGGFGIKTTT
jgi:cell division protein ZapE